MKTALTILILIGLSTFLNGQEIIVEKESLSKVNADIDTLTGIKNKLIMFRFDTLYYANQIAVSDYLDIRISNAELERIFNNLVLNMNSQLKGIQNNFGILSQNIDLNNQIVRNAIEDNNVMVNKLSNKNTQLAETNLQLSKDLQIAANAIKVDKRKRFLSHALFGTGGIVIGMGIGAYIVELAK
jgi:hypothetical protein